MLWFMCALGLLSKGVFLHMEKFSSRHNLLHTAISFEDFCEVRRFDFRPGYVNGTYLTTETQRIDLNEMMPGIWIPEGDLSMYADYRHNIMKHSKILRLGSTKRSWDEIMEFERDFLMKRYILGVYDCRHYVSEFSQWSTGVVTPIWRLRELYDSI